MGDPAAVRGDRSDGVVDYADAQTALCEEYGLDAASEYVSVEGVGRVYCLAAGDPEGDPVVFVHGGDTTGAVWVPLLAALEGYRVYVPDAPGFGLSEPFEYWNVDLRSIGRRLVAATVDAFGHDSAAVVSHSFGGYLALTAALDRPERVDRLAFVSAPLGIYEGLPPAFRLLGVPILDRIAYRFVFGGPNQSASDQRSTFERAMLSDGSHLPESLFECLAATNRIDHCRRARRSLTRTVVGLGGVPEELRLGDELADVEQPVLFVWGGDDDLSPNDACRDAAARMPNADCRVLDGDRHAVWLEEDTETPAVLSSFLGEG